MLKETPAAADTKVLPELPRAIVRALLYFAVFRYPLLPEEVWRSCDVEAQLEDVEAGLDQLVAEGLLGVVDGHYHVAGLDPELERRLAGNALARQRMEDARRSARLIAGFPFVEGVMVSGSLSKHYMEPASDVDFFIVTRPGRLWVARTLLVAYKKLFLLNSHRDFCVNYFVDTEHLEIEDKNVFTATETVFLLPVVDAGCYGRFRAANGWADARFPNFGLVEGEDMLPLRRGAWRVLGESVLGGKLGEWADGWCLRRTLARWRKKFGGLQPEHFEVAMRSRRYVSKHHPSNFQAKVTGRLLELIRGFEARHGVSLAPWPVAGNAQES